MEQIARFLFDISSSFVFWCAWIIIPILMEIIPALYSALVAFKRRSKNKGNVPSIWPEINLIIPIYNSSESIEECIASIDDSTYPNEDIRVFLVDNESTDDSFQKFTECQRKYPNLIMQWLSAEQGKSRALNLALYSSQGKYIVHIDSDGFLERHALANLVTLFENNSDVNCVTGTIMTNPDMIEQYPRGVQRFFRKLEFMEYAQSFLVGRNSATEMDMVYTISGAFSAFRNSAILKSWLYNTDTVTEDTQLAFQMRYMQGEHIVECEDAIFLADPIENLDKLYTQRQRWQRGSLEVASMFVEKTGNPLKMFTDPNMNTLMFDHTFAFPRMIWYLALLCLLFIGYSATLVLEAMAVIFGLYMLAGYIYFSVCLIFLRPFPELRDYYRRQWWVVAFLPFYNLGVFFIRLAGIINSIETTSAWKAKTLSEERDTFMGVFEGSKNAVMRVIMKIRSIVNNYSLNEESE